MSQFHLVRVMRERIARLWQQGRPASSRMASGAPSAGEPWSGHGLLRPGTDPRGPPVRRDGRHLRPQHAGVDQADLGILAARGVSVPSTPPSTLDQLRYIVSDAGIRMLFVGNSPSSIRRCSSIDSGEIRHIVALDGTRRPARLRRCQPLPDLPRLRQPPASELDAARARAPLPHGRPADPRSTPRAPRANLRGHARLRQHGRLLRDA